MMAAAATLPNLTGREAFSLEGGVTEIDARERAGHWNVSRRAFAIWKSAGCTTARMARSYASRMTLWLLPGTGCLCGDFSRRLRTRRLLPDRAGWSAGQQRRDQQQGLRAARRHPDGDFEGSTGRDIAAAVVAARWRRCVARSRRYLRLTRRCLTRAMASGSATARSFMPSAAMMLQKLTGPSLLQWPGPSSLAEILRERPKSN